MKTIICFLTVASVLAFAASGQEIKQTEKASPILLNEEEAIQEILFNEILPNKRFSDSESEKTFFCLSVNNGEDASEDLIGKFADYESKNNVKIKKASECYFYDEGGIILAGQPLKGTIFQVSKVFWKNKDEVKAEAGSRSGTIGGDGCTYTLKKENGEWKITSVEECYVS